MSGDDGRECVAVATTCSLEERLVVHLIESTRGGDGWFPVVGGLSAVRLAAGRLPAVSRIREAIDIAAPPERIWAAVHGDIPNVTRWSRDLVRTEVVGGGPLRVGSELRYVIRLPAHRTIDVQLTVTMYDEYERCSGTLRSAAGNGTWDWRYTVEGGVTHVVYEVVVNAPLALRLAAPLLERQARSATRKNLAALKKYIEGTGSRA